ncbi:5-hydroxytryptamine receptor 2C [Mizuhopecten yessoensis]|uniref:5-hydroxytryptamine receptor 2C n=1 Tax=Mizuhopecten yessoensis TaxID=6573 RepID=A0A210QLU1_MIZYE|nr:5-hydroxytryptamine receptor 2C [Mizuhopecten yessoensis]
MTAPLFVYNTTANSTWVEYDVEYEMAPNRIMEIQARFIPIILVAIPANLGIIAIILSTKTLRTKAFFLGVLSISVFDLCNGMFVLPMSLEHQLHWNEWPHGESVCIIFQVIAISKTYMSALMTTVLCFERLLAKLQSVATIDGQKVTTLSRVLIALPWCIGILVCVPLIMMNREDMSNHFTHDEYCLFVLENDFHLSILVMYLIPLGLLVLVPIAMMVVYKYKKSDWNRLSAETVEPEAVSLYMSTLCAWIVSLVYVAKYVPLTVVITLFIMCARGNSECPLHSTYENAHTISLLSSAVTPFLWIITVEIRAILTSLIARINKRLIGTVTPPDGQMNTLSFRSLQNKASSDDTVTLS